MRPNPKIIRWSAYILIGLFLIWAVDKLITSYYIFRIASINNEVKESITEQNDKNRSDSEYYSMCDSLVKLNLIDKAIKVSQDRISIHPEDKAYLTLNIGDLYFTKHDTDKAIQKYTEAINLTKNYVEAYVHRGLTYLDKNELDLAIFDFEQAARFNWDNYYLLGTVQEKKGLLDTAKKSFEIYLKHYPNNRDCKVRLDSVNLKLKKNNGS